MVDVRRFFESRLRRYGDSPRSLDWSDRGQRRRFEVLAEIGDMNAAEVFDVGCGLGHLHDFLRGRYRSVRYRGFDFSPKMVATARNLHPGTLFEVHDALATPLPGTADFVLASGVLNVESGNNDAAMRLFLRRCFEASRKGAAVNMLSARAERFTRNRHYFDPVRMIREAMRVTRSVALRHDYLPHDFTLYLYREERP